VNLESRSALFYSDLNFDDKTGKIVISKIPFINEAYFERAITTFEKAIEKYEG
jgi:hypothetical protein